MSSDLTLPCHICGKLIDLSATGGSVKLYLHGVKEELLCHPKCVMQFMNCKGDISKIPDGPLKRAMEKNISEQYLIHETGITITRKQGVHIFSGLRESKDEGIKRIQSLAIDFYGLPKLEEDRYYYLDLKRQIVVLSKEPKPTLVVDHVSLN